MQLLHVPDLSSAVFVTAEPAGRLHMQEIVVIARLIFCILHVAS